MGQTETDRQTDRQTYATLLNAQADPAHHVGRDQASYFGLGPKSEAQRVESGDRVLGEEQPALSPPARGSGECWKFLQRGQGRSTGR